MSIRRFAALALACALSLGACTDGDPPETEKLSLTRLKVDRTYLRDAHDRYVMFHGVNLSGSNKVPVIKGAGAKDFTYIGKPFPMAEADKRFKELRDAGFNVVRLLVMWEGVEPTAKGVYDTAYLAYIRDLVKLAGKYGIYVLMDFHQDMFSRHLKVYFNDQPDDVDATAKPGSVEWILLSLVNRVGVATYPETVQGDGAPKWAVQACLQEKKMDSVHWGKPRLLAGLAGDVTKVEKTLKFFSKLLGQDQTASTPAWANKFGAYVGLLPKYDVDETTDMLPFTNWGLAHTLSKDVARAYACLYAGDVAFPKLKVGAQGIEDYLQEAYANAWVQVAKQVKDLPNVVGYDIMNEPGGNFITLSASAAMMQFGVHSAAKDLLISLLGKTDGAEMYDALVALSLLPPDTQPATLKKWGLDQLDVMGVLGLNSGFDENHLRPFYERVGKAILKVDPRALIWIESSSNISLLTGDGGKGGLGGMWETPMRHPQGPELKDRVVYAPHWYPDIYPNLGFNVEPRPFTAEQVRYREKDYQKGLEGVHSLAAYSMGNLPVVFGEFGTYFNFNNKFLPGGKLTNNAKANAYQISAHVLDNYYEAFEAMLQSNILWCYSPENQERLGDLWNREDFSVLGPDQEWRASTAWSRPHPRALAGKPLETHFYSPLHYFDPDKGVVPPVGEYYLRYGSRETGAPTEIFVPQVQYKNGFYVWLSDGHCHWDSETRTLYHYPDKDDPQVEHWIKLLPPLAKREAVGWRYFVNGDRVVTGN